MGSPVVRTLMETGPQQHEVLSLGITDREVICHQLGLLRVVEVRVPDGPLLGIEPLQSGRIELVLKEAKVAMPMLSVVRRAFRCEEQLVVDRPVPLDVELAKVQALLTSLLTGCQPAKKSPTVAARAVTISIQVPS